MGFCFKRWHPRSRIWKLLGCLSALMLCSVFVLQKQGSAIIQKHILDAIDATPLKNFSKTLSVNISVQSTVQPTQNRLIPTDLIFQEYGIGDCVNNRDSSMKKLSRNCGCPPERPSHGLNECCRLYMLIMIKDAYGEMIKSGVPFILIGQAIKGWLTNKQLMSNALSVSTAVPYTYWYSDVYLGVMKHLASRGYCIWFRTPLRMEIWNSVVSVDIRPWSVVGEEIYFAGDVKGNPYKISSILPKQLAVLGGIKVYLPNKPREYIDQLESRKTVSFETSSFIPTKEQVFPTEAMFESREIGSCDENGASELKNLPTSCGCGPEIRKSHNIHPCCRRHLLKLLKEIYMEMVIADIPMILTGGAVIGWYRNKKLVPYDEDIDGGLEYKYWSSPRYLQCLDRLAKKGFCVWFRTPTWTKIWSTVVAFDLFAFNVVEGKEVIFDGPDENGPYNVSHILPRKLDVLEGIDVFLPNNPEKYMDRLYGKGNWETPWH